ncbi:MAG: hypothetical protein U5P41_10495 [Gammaproteobacteria bacterium]|nr:hypothetical protein [Gammaproteobacteria bacterium]
MSQEGGQTTKDRIFVHELDPALAKKIQIKFYNTGTIQNIAKDAPEDGFSILLIPALTEMHLQYAQHAPEYEDMFIKPIAGWVTGIHLDDLGKVKPTVFNGGTGESSTENAIVIACRAETRQGRTHRYCEYSETGRRRYSSNFRRPDFQPKVCWSMASNRTLPITCSNTMSIPKHRWSGLFRSRC